MSTGWGWMTGWWGSCLAIVTLLLARSLHRVIGKICRPRGENRSGTLEFLSGKDDAQFEIVAIPGLGAHPYHTWEARKTQGPNAADYRTAQSSRAHLLKDLLAHDFPDARIWNFAHDSNWLIDAPVKTTEEIGKCLLKEIKDKLSSPHLPIIFIGHSLGGIIIKQALCRSDAQDVVDNTAGIIFLGAPHQGSSVSVAGAVLASVTGILGSDTTLLLSLRNHDAQLSNLADAFGSRIAPNERRQRKVPVISFYETKKTYLLGLSLGVVVSRDSAVVHADAKESHSIETDHSGLNKCGGPTDTLFTKLAMAIRRLKIPSLLEQADTLIREKHYAAERLRVERLSGEPLAMDQCYINLAIVERHGQDAGHFKKERDTASSPFSILARQKVETPDETMQVDLSAIFDERKGTDDEPMHPRRILIRGRAGVGKTTLCKKIVHDFGNGTWGKWNELFDRVLWVPLRNLKLPERRSMPKYTFEDLFSHEFLLPANGQNLAGALFRALNSKSSKTLFLLDGLDEVSQDLTGDGGMPRFLAELLSQPNIIVTSRPSAKPPPNLHLELETIGFGPDQVNEYIEKSFTNPKTAKTDQTKVDEVRSFLQKHWLVQGLVRIPIQLDALCYTWEEFDPTAVPSTMTGMYNTIVQKLWKKDIVRLEKVKEGYAKIAHAAEIEDKVTAEIALVECLAFSGLHHDIIDFTPEHRHAVVKLCPLHDLPLDEALSRLSFLRTSDTVSNIKDRNYHFIHLTFQEYFAARYFARQWKGRKAQLQFLTFSSKGTEAARSPAEFLRKHKYTARYDIFWRFVAGLLDGNDQAPEFINTVEEEPLDLLGPTHQRLIMHCLSEINSGLPMREVLEKRLAQWLLFECNFNGSAQLASEEEFPDSALEIALLPEASDTQATILQSLANRASISRSIVERVVKWLGAEDGYMRQAAVTALGSQVALPDEALMAVAARLDDKDMSVQYAAIETLNGKAALPAEVLKAVAVRLDHKDSDERRNAVKALDGKAPLPYGILVLVAARLDDEEWYVRKAAVEALSGQAAVPDEVLMKLAARVEDENDYVQRAAVKALDGKATLPAEVLMAVALRLNHNSSDVRWGAANILSGKAALPGEVLTAMVARLDDENADVRKASIMVLSGQATLSCEVLVAVAARIDDEDSYLRRAAIEALNRQSALSSETLMAVRTRLDDENSGVRRAAVETLHKKAVLSCELIVGLAARFDDENSDVQRAAIVALNGKAALPCEILVAVAARLDNEHWQMRRAAIRALSGQATLSDDILMTMVGRLDDENSGVRGVAVKTLGGRVTLPNEVLMAVVARLDHEDKYIQKAAVKTLCGRATLPDEVLMAVVARFDYEDWHVQRAAIEALGGQATLPDKVLMAVVAQLGNKSKNIRRAAVKALGGQAAQLDDEDWYVQMVAAEALGGRMVLPLLNHEFEYILSAAFPSEASKAALPVKVLVAVAARLAHKDESVRSAAIMALIGQAALPDKVLMTVAARLYDKDKNAQYAAIRLLGGRATLPDDVLMAVVSLFGLKDKYIRMAAVKILGEQAALPNLVFITIAAWLGNEDEDVRSAAIKTLDGKVALPRQVLVAVAARLNDKDLDVQRAAIKALSGQAALPVEVLVTVAARLGNEDPFVRNLGVQKAALDILMDRHQKLHCTLYARPLVESLCKALLQRSFAEQFSWYIDKGHSCVNMRDGIRERSIDAQRSGFRQWISGARPADCPLISDGETAIGPASR